MIVLGNSPGRAGDLTLAYVVMREAIDVPAVHGALRLAGLPTEDGQSRGHAAERLLAVLAKAEPSSDRQIRGRWHIMCE